MIIYEYVNHKGKGEISAWRGLLPRETQAKLDQYLERLEQVGVDSLHNLVAPTGKTHIRKLRVNGKIALRPMLCRGPEQGENAITFLVAAVEKDRKLVPRYAIEQAATRRTEVIENPRARRREYEPR